VGPGVICAETRREPRIPGLGKRVTAGEKGPTASPRSTPRFNLNIPGHETYDSLIAEGWVQGKPCQVTIDTGALVTIARPEIFAGQPERNPSRTYVLQTDSVETIPVFNDAFVELILGRRALGI